MKIIFRCSAVTVEPYPNTRTRSDIVAQLDMSHSQIADAILGLREILRAIDPELLAKIEEPS